ncbi:hypothetical protein [Paeniglutamicibacter cryotolerans]|uniref:1,4-dihydroxy-2-naphthoate octaprenyltransferase n=1 Tax=Paeniglutamicibacter cryotolerans TaxID=670079 RepID=A0A839QS61_9MICC|nr:hypothetical protein [Paeniglutamicibacter cryotolerans]MBB2994881.1 1,4-dihydroxy-2-naphthoate octaprenyltransferase [Paeniglutamicibacter cryotolerans]
MNIEFLRSPWFLAAVVLLVGGAYAVTVLAWGIAGWASIVLGLVAMVIAVRRQRL